MKELLALLALFVLGSSSRAKSSPASSSTPKSSPAKSSAVKTGELVKIQLATIAGLLRPVVIYFREGLTSANELVLFLHGDNPSVVREKGKAARPATLAEIIERHNLGAQIAKASEGRRARSVWVVPFSLGECDDFNATIKDTARLMDFVNAIQEAIKAQGITLEAPRLVLAGQSRARNPLSLLVAKLAPKELFLFDALHNTTKALQGYANNKGARVWVVYSAATQKGTAAFRAALKTEGRELFQAAPISDPIKTPAPDVAAFLAGASLAEAGYSFTEQDLRAPLGFVASSAEHKNTARYHLAAVMG